MDRGAWWVIAHRVSKSWTRLSNCTHTRNIIMAQYLIIFTVPRIRIASLGGKVVLQHSTTPEGAERKETLHKGEQLSLISYQNNE